MADFTSPSIVKRVTSVADSTYNYTGTNTPSVVESYKAKAEAQNMVQATTNGASKGAFKWIERIVTPSMFANPDATLVAIGPPVASLASGVTDFKLVGMCNNFSFNTQNNVFTFKELRAERNIIIPMKSMPGQLSLSRLLGAFPNFSGLVSGAETWVYNNQGRTSKKLFGLLLIFMNMHRSDTMGTLYFERCCVNSRGATVPAGQNSILESVGIVFDRVIDSFQASSVGTGASSTSTSTTTTSTT